MMIHIDVAKKKWCPMARTMYAREVPSSVNRNYSDGGPDSDCLCLTNDCMMWVIDLNNNFFGKCGLCGVQNGK